MGTTNDIMSVGCLKESISQQPTHTKEILGPLRNAKQQSGYREQQLHRRRNSAQLSISPKDFFSSSLKANQFHVASATFNL